MGGGTEGKDLLTTAKEEFQEETGYRLKNVKKIPIKPMLAPWGNIHSEKQKKRAEKYAGSRTWFVTAEIDGPKGKKATGEDGATLLKKVKFYKPSEIKAHMKPRKDLTREAKIGIKKRLEAINSLKESGIVWGRSRG